jgi:predicted DNA-binding transcriptional regulator YafY
MKPNEKVVVLADGYDGQVIIDYTNYKGERAKRRIEPERLYWGSNEWHPEPGLLLDAYDVEKYANRTFALKSIHFIESVEE